MTSLKYISDRWKYISYAVASILAMLSIAVGLLWGNYRLVLPYIVPLGSGTRAGGTAWTLFNQPWLLPIGSSASLTDTIIGIGFLLAFAPVVYVSYANHRYLRSVERNIPRFLEDIRERIDSGLILPKALLQAAATDYGPISHEIGIAMTKFSLGYDFKLSIMEACQKLRHRYMLQVGVILVEAYGAGGKVHDVLNSSVALFNGLEQHEEEKRSELKPYTQLVYISVVIFLVIALIIVSQFISPLDRLPSSTNVASTISGIGSQFSAGISRMPVAYFESVFFISGIFESIFGGIVIGKIAEGSAFAGLRHTIILLLITIVMFNAPVVGIFATP